MPDRLMIDPSMFLWPDTFPVLIEALNRKELGRVAIPHAFASALRDGVLEENFVRFFGPRRGAVTAPEILSRFTVPELIEEYSPKSFRLEGSVFDQRLSEVSGSDLVRRTLVEEWEFLTSESWIISKVRAAFDGFLKSGAVALEVGGNAFDWLAAKSLKIPPERVPDGLNVKQRLRAVAKWIAVGGASATAVVAPPVAVGVGAASGFFLLLDP